MYYDYQCPAGHKQELNLTMNQATLVDRVQCNVTGCGKWASRVFNPLNFTFGWRLSDESQNVKGTVDKFVRDV